MSAANDTDPGLTSEVMSAVKEVHSVLGHGMHIGICQGALEVELANRGIQFRSRPEIPVRYKGQILKKRYRPDFILYDRIILQIASGPALTQEDEQTLKQYLRMCGLVHGLLANFGTPKLEIRRIGL